MIDETANEEPEAPAEGEEETTEQHDDADTEGAEPDESEEEGDGEGSETEEKPDVEALSARAKAAEDNVKATQDLLVKVLATQGKDPQEEARKERERVAAMSPEERLLYAAESAERRVHYATQQAEFKIKDANDRADFTIMCAKNPVAAKLQGEVEKRLAEERAKGMNYDRKNILIYLAGEKALAAAEKGGNRKQKREAAENTRKSSTTATKAAGDKKANGKLDPNSREARLERLRDARF